MSVANLEPPYILDSALVLYYAVLDDSVTYTGRITTYVSGKLLGPVPRLALCENLAEDSDFLTFYCNDDWEVLGVGGSQSLEAALSTAERAYSGVKEKWRRFRLLNAEELAYVEAVRSFVRSEHPSGPYPEPPGA